MKAYLSRTRRGAFFPYIRPGGSVRKKFDYFSVEYFTEGGVPKFSTPFGQFWMPQAIEFVSVLICAAELVGVPNSLSGGGFITYTLASVPLTSPPGFITIEAVGKSVIITDETQASLSGGGALLLAEALFYRIQRAAEYDDPWDREV